MIHPQNNKPDKQIRVVQVCKPLLLPYDSFAAGLSDPRLQTRMRRARTDWTITDNVIIRSYYYEDATLWIDFGLNALKISCNGPSVDWQLCDSYLKTDSDMSPIIIQYVDSDQKPEVFDRDACLANLIGNRIRYAPTANELVLLLHSGQEIGITSLPMADQNGGLLYYKMMK